MRVDDIAGNFCRALPDSGSHGTLAGEPATMPPPAARSAPRVLHGSQTRRA
jgi:hypothetical protein